LGEKYIGTQIKGTGMKYLLFIVFLVIVVMTAGCIGGNKNTATTTSIPTNKPIASFGANQSSGSAPLTVQFINLATNADTYYWDFGDFNTSTLANPFHTYTNEGKYTVILTASDGFTTDLKIIEAFVNVTYPPDFSQATHAEVTTLKAHWSSGAEYDGITVNPSLMDAKNQEIKWSGVALPVDIEIYTTKYDTKHNEVKNQLVYKGNGTILNWREGAKWAEGGIQIPFASMKVPPNEKYGWLYVTIHTPDGKTYSGKNQFVPLTQ
jgi:PKD repeat protein